MSKRKGSTGQIALVETRAGLAVPIERYLELTYLKKGVPTELPAPARPLADTHAHLMSFWKVEPACALARAAAAGVGALTTIWDPVADARVAATAATFHEQLLGWIAEAREQLAQGIRAGVVDERRAEPMLFERVGYLVGVHPYGAPDYTDAVHEQVVEALSDPLCRGVGEIGLDYHFDADDDIEAAPHGMQMDVMARQLELACTRNVPVELHLRNDAGDETREAHADAYRVLTEVGLPQAGCVLHCFGEDRATMERFVELGCSIAYGGAATFKSNEAVREAFAATPLDRILFETDCPYMAPEPLRGMECEPALIALTADALAHDRAERTGEDPARILQAAWENARTMLG